MRTLLEISVGNSRKRGHAFFLFRYTCWPTLTDMAEVLIHSRSEAATLQTSPLFIFIYLYAYLVHGASLAFCLSYHNQSPSQTKHSSAKHSGVFSLLRLVFFFRHNFCPFVISCDYSIVKRSRHGTRNYAHRMSMHARILNDNMQMAFIAHACV